MDDPLLRLHVTQIRLPFWFAIAILMLASNANCVRSYCLSVSPLFPSRCLFWTDLQKLFSNFSPTASLSLCDQGQSHAFKPFPLTVM